MLCVSAWNIEEFSRELFAHVDSRAVCTRTINECYCPRAPAGQRDVRRASWPRFLQSEGVYHIRKRSHLLYALDFPLVVVDMLDSREY
jgi:hypothetical protein